MNNLTFTKSTLKQGIVMGLGFCLYTTIMWLTKLDSKFLNYGQYLDIAIILLPIVMIFSAIRQENKIYKITLIKRIVIAVYVGLVSFLIYDPFLYVYHHFINPEWFNSVLNLEKMKLITENIPQNQILEKLQKMKASNIARAELYRLEVFLPTVIIIPSIIAFVSLIFIKTKRD